MEITEPIPASEWTGKVTQPGDELEILPYDSAIAEERYDGGHVIEVHDADEDNTYMFALPPEAIPLLEGLLPVDQYRTLLTRTPKRADMAIRM